MAALGYRVILGSRSAERGRAAASLIRARVPAAEPRVVQLDLADLASVATAAAELAASTDGRSLNALICNAGVQITGGVERSSDGYERTFATNHLGHYLLVRLLLGNLAEQGRVIVVSSGVHRGPRHSLGFPAPRWASPRLLADAEWAARDVSATAGRVRYANSKLANLYFAYELARRLRGRSVTVNAFDPGLMPRTGLARDYPPRVRRAYHAAAPLLVKLIPMARDPGQSGADLAWLATAAEFDQVTGAFVVGRRPRRSSPESHDEGRAAELWAISAELVKAYLGEQDPA
jgi:NAD(P)-dependent dehydrogenase (short-subunit alcohol dehydrogenase family)